MNHHAQYHSQPPSDRELIRAIRVQTVRFQKAQATYRGEKAALQALLDRAAPIVSRDGTESSQGGQDR